MHYSSAVIQQHAGAAGPDPRMADVLLPEDGYVNPLRTGVHAKVILSEMGLFGTHDPLYSDDGNGGQEMKTRLNLGRLPKEVCDLVLAHGVQLLDIPALNARVWDALPAQVKRMLRAWVGDGLNDERRHRTRWASETPYRQLGGQKGQWFGSHKMNQVSHWVPDAADSWPLTAPAGADVDKRRSMAFDAWSMVCPLRTVLRDEPLIATKDLLAQALLNGWPTSQPAFLETCTKMGLVLDCASATEVDVATTSRNQPPAQMMTRRGAEVSTTEPSAKRQAR